MSISTGAISELAISQINVPQELTANAVMFAFNPQDANFVLPAILDAEAVRFAFTGEFAIVGFPGPPKTITQLNLPDFDIPSAWTIDFGDPVIDYAGFSPRRGAFLVVLVDGNFALWLRQSQGVMRGLMLATVKRTFLRNLGPPFLASFIP
jgi:hypothetical protein